MSRNTPELYRKNLRIKSKWFDDIKKDNRFYGVGTVNNQIHYPNGAREEHKFEDRSFAYEFKENVVFAYGLLDGYEGSWAVDFVEQCIMTSLYFDHLSTLESKTDEEVIEILQAEFHKTEQALQDNLQSILMDRASLSIQAAELKRGSLEFVSNRKKIAELDKFLNSGSFATVALIIENRLFLANVGTNHCFIYKYNAKTNEQQVVSIETEHNLSNNAEMMRLMNLNANLDKMSISYTRCLGDFKIKLYYHELPEFSDCTSPPITCKPSLHHHSSSILIDDSSLFMVMYSDALVKVIEDADLKGNVKVNVKIVKLLIDKILSEQTLNSAAQSFLDEIKRAYDDKFASEFTEREDLTLIIRVFDSNIKARLSAIKMNQTKETRGSLETRRSIFESTLHKTESNSNEANEASDSEDGYFRTITTRLSDTSYDSESVRELNMGISEIDKKLDEKGCVISYINLEKEFESLLNGNQNAFKEFEDELLALEKN